ncbi:MOSC domain-containing protein [Thermomonospora umbrina]|uniref:MOSC domain-containing protein n=1 Tax=Thermomonospora umbrina TaxID=111806 RepID=A0A3D9SKI1_9ACTN|nr:MOSC N-terminal beta barrel domain-containing protein [Thermomonospora umbrina]REE96388.1 hypothetical protein DFJ69_1821 [Thermomonospora umbrina]
MVVVTALHIYPVKSAAGVTLTEAQMNMTGLRHDRAFMLIRPDGRHLSQREAPGLAQVHPEYDGAKLTVHTTLAPTPLICEPIDGPARRVTVHGRPCQGIDQGDEAAAWFTAALGRPCRLVPFTGTRSTTRGDGTLTYADGAPLSVLSTESLNDLNRRLDSPLPIDRFRPNLVLTGLGPYGEDTATRLRLGTTEIELTAFCGRCLILNTDQRTARRERTPLHTLAGYRTRTSEAGRAIVFGRLAVPRVPGPLSVGDRVTVLESDPVTALDSSALRPSSPAQA